jgi:MFS family permease
MPSWLAERGRFLTVLRHREYRLYFGGLLISVAGFQMLLATIGWLAFQISGSTVALGIVGGTHALPALVFNLFGGALADRFNPRKLIIIGQALAGAVIAGMAAVTFFSQAQLWHLLLGTFLASIALGIDQPARRMIWAYLVPRDEYVYAISLNQTVWSSTRVFAPGLAGGLIAFVGAATGNDSIGAAAALMATVAGFLVMVLAMALVRMGPIERSTGETVFHDVVDGLHYVRGSPVFLYLLGLSFIAGFFGLSYAILMPVFAEDYFNTGSGGFGLLLSVNGVGGIIGTITVASFGRYQDRPWLLIGGAVATGITIVIFAAVAAISGSLALGLFVLVLVGLAFALFQIAAGTVINLLVSDQYRGRVLSLRSIMFSLAPLGGLAAGGLAVAIGAAAAVAIGGAVVAVSGGGAYLMSRDIRHLREVVASGTQAEPAAAG